MAFIVSNQWPADGMTLFQTSPFACRKDGSSRFMRELVLPFGSTGYVALFEIADNVTVIIDALKVIIVRRKDQADVTIGLNPSGHQYLV